MQRKGPAMRPTLATTNEEAPYVVLIIEACPRQTEHQMGDLWSVLVS